MKNKNLNIDQILDKACEAGKEFQHYNQQKTDQIVKEVYETGFNHRISLAKLALQETRLGVLKDKILKNVIATRLVYEDIKDQKTVGIISHDQVTGITEIARPLGPILCITPITNPTSTILFKILIGLKTRNPLIIRPHGSAKKCGAETARICNEAALRAGAPKNCIQWIYRSSKEDTLALMGHEKTALILATGSVSLVKAAARSGTPSIGVGPGNVPVYIGKSAYVPFAVEQIVKSKTFDHGTVCASEQAVIVRECHVESAIKEFKKRKGYFLSRQEIKLLEVVAFDKVNKVMRVEVIGQSASNIAKMAGFKVPRDTSLLIAPLTDVGIKYPLSMEILAPILAFYESKDFETAIELCRKINVHGGLGHTVSIFSDDDEKIDYFASEMNAGRIVVNTPSSQGALGGTFNSLVPSLTLGCGSAGGNMTTDNITAKHLLNIHRIARRRLHKCIAHFDSDYFYEESFDARSFSALLGDNNLEIIPK